MSDLQRELEAERKLAVALATYEHQWVAIRDHEVVASATLLDDLLELIEDEDIQSVFRVSPGGVSFFGVGLTEKEPI